MRTVDVPFVVAVVVDEPRHINHVAVCARRGQRFVVANRVVVVGFVLRVNVRTQRGVYDTVHDLRLCRTAWRLARRGVVARVQRATTHRRRVHVAGRVDGVHQAAVVAAERGAFRHGHARRRGVVVAAAAAHEKAHDGRQQTQTTQHAQTDEHKQRQQRIARGRRAQPAAGHRRIAADGNNIECCRGG